MAAPEAAVGRPARWTSAWAVPLALVAGYVAQVLFRLSLVRGQDYPVVNPDEHMYLVIARMLAGRSTTEIPGNEVIPAGYSLLISPALRITDDPELAYHLIMGINALLSCLVLPLGYLAMRRLAMPRPLAYLFATAAVLMPPVVFYSQYAMADTPLPALVLAWLIGVHGLLSEGSTRRRIGYGLLAGTAAGYCLLTHDRGGVIVALTALVLLVVLVLGWAPRVATALALVMMGALFYSKQLMTSWLLANIDGAHPSKVGNAVFDSLGDSALLRRTVMRMLGHLWYFVTSSWGLGALAAVVCVLAVFTSRFSKADRVVAFLMVSLMCGIALAAAAGLPDDHRIDTIVYARYLSPLVPVFFLVGAVVLYRTRKRKHLVLLAGSAALLMVTLALLVNRLAGREFKKSWFILWGMPDSTFLGSLWGDDWDGFHLMDTTAVALLVFGLVVAVRLLAGSRRALPVTGAIGVVLACFAAFATVSVTDHITKPNTAGRYGDATGFLEDAGIKPGDKVVMDNQVRWEIQVTLPSQQIEGRVWNRDLVRKDTPPADATVAVLALWVKGETPDKSWRNAPAGWHVDRHVAEKNYVVWRRG
ncbi:hypothetical protein F4556_004244 [Kitasatospora gansuensis]|uniref:Glycosyltransferase RgtA/B/C/D-like domain-containing protein n=1 Tax=Kitasatospora gansuensis TaxID=258050 RepID=A0A7W7SDY3_9ACTN|nr:hypothetical protein [Kitasatospora gansuensis]MBB4948709.1 hypothetical protein [Kitasatospora gansuensis]